jgi:hypothetical protein
VEPLWEPFLAWIASTLGSEQHSMKVHRAKLAKSGCDERHLFIGVTDATPDAYMSLVGQLGVVPPDSPMLPPEITHLWVMDCDGDRCLVWFPDINWFDPSAIWGEAPEELEERC